MHSIQTEFFEHIDSELKAYILAWFWSRGSGHIQVTKCDLDILVLIQNAIKYTGKIHIYNNTATLNITLPAFRRHLAYSGCAINKTHIQSFPIISSQLMRHFIRGIYDSYGTSYIVKQKYLNINIIYEENFITLLRNYLLDELNIKTKHYYRYSHTNTIQMMITKSSDSVKFLNWLYLDSNYYLTRKFEKYQRYA